MITVANNPTFFFLAQGSQLKEVYMSLCSACAMQELMRMVEERKLRANWPMDGILSLVE